MTTTILAVIALTGSMAPAAKPEFQAQTDYGQALKQAAEQKKPMAVLIGKGDAFAKVMTDTGLSAEAKKLLTEKYVCVSVNVETDAGKTLAGQFQLTDGLVISSAGGTYQALRQAGTVSAADLAKHTATYANANGTPATTVTAGTPVTTSTSFYAPAYAPAAAAPTYTIGGCANGSCGSVYSLPSYGGCSGGSCPTYTTGGGRFRR
jgi:hypothetical protein